MSHPAVLALAVFVAATALFREQVDVDHPIGIDSSKGAHYRFEYGWHLV